MTRAVKLAAGLFLITLAAACAPAKKAAMAPAPPGIDWNARIAEADALYAAGHYTAFRDALRIYGEAMAVPGHDAGVAEKLIRSTVALELRKRDLGVLTAGPLRELAPLIAADPSLDRAPLRAS
jgi:hypothetical protein